MPRPASASASPVVRAVTDKAPGSSPNSGLPVAEVGVVSLSLGDIKTTVETVVSTASETRVDGDGTGEGEGENGDVDMEDMDMEEGEGGLDQDEEMEEEEETEGSMTGSDLDDDRPPTSMPDHRTPDERCTAPNSFPSKLRDLELGWRLDALDGQGGWYAATVVEVRR